MLKKLAAASLATSIAFAPAVFLPMTAMSQPTVGEPKASTPAARAKAKAICTGEAKAKGLRGKPGQRFITQCEKSYRGVAG